MHESTLPEPLLDEDALAALNRTRPWLYLLGVVSCVLSALALIVLLAGIVGMHTNSAKASVLIGAGIAALLITVPSAITQLGYAAALSRVGQAAPESLPEAVELACIRQRHLWIVNALTVGIIAATIVLQLIFQGAPLA